MKTKPLLKDFYRLDAETFALHCSEVISLLLEDHEAMRKLMEGIQSPRSSSAKIQSSYRSLKRLVTSHMAAEELALLNHLRQHDKFEAEANESYEEHRIHEHIFAGIAQLRSHKRALMQMKIYCEILEHHLKEEERDLFPAYKKYFALSTRKKAGLRFFKKRVKTSKGSQRGALSR